MRHSDAGEHGEHHTLPHCADFHSRLRVDGPRGLDRGPPWCGLWFQTCIERRV